MAATKTFLDLSVEDKTEFLSLYSTFKAADKESDRAKTSWKFLCFVYKHLGEEMLTYFVNDIFNDKDGARETIVRMVKLRAFLQPNL